MEIFHLDSPQYLAMRLYLLLSTTEGSFPCGDQVKHRFHFIESSIGHQCPWIKAHTFEEKCFRQYFLSTLKKKKKAYPMLIRNLVWYLRKAHL